MKTLKVFSLFNLKIHIGNTSCPEGRDSRISKHRPTLASQTANTRKIKIKSENRCALVDNTMNANRYKDNASRQSNITKAWFILSLSFRIKISTPDIKMFNIGEIDLKLNWEISSTVKMSVKIFLLMSL